MTERWALGDRWFRPWCESCKVRPGKGTDGPVFECTMRRGCAYQPHVATPAEQVKGSQDE